MHHVVLERWSRGTSYLHRRDPRAKIIILFTFLVVVSSTPIGAAPFLLVYAVLPVLALLAARLPLGGALARAAAILPFCAVFAVISFAAGDSARAVALVEKSYLSALAVLAIAGATPMPLLINGLRSLRVPRFLLQVIQFLYRYLFVISEQAQHMRLAAASRGGLQRSRFSTWRLRAAAGAVAVLFWKSYHRAEATYRAMLSRGFEGRFHLLAAPAFGWADVLLLVLGVMGPLALRLSMVLLGKWTL